MESIDDAGQKTVVYETVERVPQTWQVFSAFYKGFVDKADIIVFILIIAILVQLLENILKKFIPTLYKSLGVYLPLITTNCTILGVTILNIDNGYNFMESIVCAAGAGIGFLVAMVLFSGVRRKVEEAVTPKCFEGLPITLVSAAVTSLSFMGFGGIIESIFHV